MTLISDRYGLECYLARGVFHTEVKMSDSIFAQKCQG
jgi:hypothetical protein